MISAIEEAKKPESSIFLTTGKTQPVYEKEYPQIPSLVIEGFEEISALATQQNVSLVQRPTAVYRYPPRVAPDVVPMINIGGNLVPQSYIYWGIGGIGALALLAALGKKKKRKR